ncbi:fimbria/pilus outer membrane usher protein [Leclercia sp. AS011]|uniref:fimbria/pilus outer membrane usher protein n=1 Tax=Leclercia sp. AS011 TaxID=3081257 RepID=UPI00301825E7
MATNLKYTAYSLALISLCWSSYHSNVLARDFFNPAFLNGINGSHEAPDLSAFENENAQAPGKYRVDIIINDMFIDTRDVEFMLNTAPGAQSTNTLKPCISVKELQAFGVRTDNFPGLSQGTKGCAEITAIPDASYEFIFPTQTLRYNFPQAALSPVVRGYVPPEKYDDGITALLMNYQFNASNSYARQSQGNDTENYNLNLRPGFNIGAWRVRNYTSWNRADQTSSAGKWDTVYTYAERNIQAIKSVLTLGESTSPGDVFDSVPYTGAQLASEDQMDPDSMQGYAPVVRGIAKTNAKIIIKQNGYMIYQSYVRPGPFEITDMYSTGGSGDLQVTVEESDGSKQEFIVPYASLPVLRREGSLKYGVTTGRYRSYNNYVDETPFTQATASYGLPLGATLFGGFQAASRFQSLAIGFGQNMGKLGALSIDVTQAWSTLKDKVKTTGQSWRIRYSKNLTDIGTNFSIAGYRYSTSGFNTLGDVLESYRDGSGEYNYNRVRNRTEATISQNLGSGNGSMTLSGIIEDYWNEKRRNTSLSVGYNNTWKWINYSLNYSYNRSSRISSNSSRDYDSEKLFSLSLSVPFGGALTNTWATYSMNTGNPGSTTNTLGLNGTALEQNNLSWNVQQSYDNRQYGSGSTGVNYDGTYGQVFTSYDYDHNAQRINYGAAGSVLIHRDGVTMGQQIGETATLVKAPGVANTNILNQTGVKTDYRGYAIIPFSTPYRYNEVMLDSETFADNIDMDITTQKVVPTRGAIVQANFSGNVGQRAIIRLINPTGKVIPFGATVTDESQPNNSSIVNDNGMVYLTGLATTGTLNVQWGKKENQSCTATFSLANAQQQVGIVQSQAECR